MPIDYGTCISVTDDLPLRWKFVSGTRAVAEAIVRRWSTERGELPYDPDYGTDARDGIGDVQAAGLVGDWTSRLEREAEKDERVQACAVTITYSAAAATATVSAQVTLDEGPTFQLVVAVDDLTVALLRVT